MPDVRAVLQRDARAVGVERRVELVVRQVVRHPHRHLGDARGELLDLHTVKLIHGDAAQQHRVDLLIRVQRLEALQLQPPDLAIRDYQEVAAPARRIEEGEARQLRLIFQQRRFTPRPPRDQPVQLGGQLVQEQRPDHLQDVRLGRVVRANLAALVGAHHRLEQAAEDRRAHPGPVVARRVEQHRPHRGVEHRRPQPPGEQRAVNVGKGVQLGAQAALALGLGRVEHVEQLVQRRSDIMALVGGVVVDQLEEDVFGLEDAGVVGEQAEQQADQQLLQVVPAIPRLIQRVMQSAHQLGRLDRHACLRLEGDAAAEHEVERLDVPVQVGESEGQRLARAVPVAQHPCLKVARQDEARLLILRNALQIVERLQLRLAQVEPRALLLDQQRAGPEGVDEAVAIVRQPDSTLVIGELAAIDAEHLKEVVVEGLRLAALIAGVLPLLAERPRAAPDLVPPQPHAFSLTLAWRTGNDRAGLQCWNIRVSLTNRSFASSSSPPPHPPRSGRGV